MAENISDSELDSELWMRQLIRQMSDEYNLPKRNEESVKNIFFKGTNIRETQS